MADLLSEDWQIHWRFRVTHAGQYNGKYSDSTSQNKIKSIILLITKF